MNKKGFTLVELLAVIAILAILVLIAMPNVLGMFNKSKKSAFKTEVQSTLKQVDTDHVLNSMEGYAAKYLYTNAGSNTVVTDFNKATDTENHVESAEFKKLNLDTSKKYAILVDNSGSILKAVIWDNSFCYSSNPGKKYNEITDGDIKDYKGFTNVGLCKEG